MNAFRFYVGTYTRPIRFGTGQIMRGKGKGIYLCELEAGSGAMRTLGVRDGIPNPSYLALGRDGKTLYAVNELKDEEDREGGTVSAFSVDGETGALGTLDVQPTRGADPCHVAVSPGGGHVVVSNFMSGGVTVLPIREDGGLGPPACVVRHSGSGPNPRRQAGPHAHAGVFSPDGRWLYVPDLGLDKVVRYRLDPVSGTLTEDGAYAAPPGSGPRYCEFHPRLPLCYLINELGSSISRLSYEARTGALCCLQTESTLPSPVKDNICADLHITPDGQYLYGSNRGADSIAAFRLDGAGRMERIETCSCGGRTPRNFALDPTGTYAVVANQDSDVLVCFAIGPGGRLTERSRLEVPSPVCVRMV